PSVPNLALLQPCRSLSSTLHSEADQHLRFNGPGSSQPLFERSSRSPDNTKTQLDFCTDVLCSCIKSRPIRQIRVPILLRLWAPERWYTPAPICRDTKTLCRE